MTELKQTIKDWILKRIEITGKDHGVSTDEIQRMEQKHNITFPLAYKDFLQLTGKYFAPLAGIGGHRFEYLEVMQSNARKNLKEYGLAHLMPKNWWVVAEWDGSEVIWYIDLDAGDDPPVYGFNIVEYAYEPSDEWFGKEADSFSDWINMVIEEYNEKNQL